jgi:hypothetical protein
LWIAANSRANQRVSGDPLKVEQSMKLNTNRLKQIAERQCYLQRDRPVHESRIQLGDGNQMLPSMEENKQEIMIENLAERVGFELHPSLIPCNLQIPQ